jgi:hypothetical protein
VSIAECIWPVKIVYQISLKGTTFSHWVKSREDWKKRRERLLIFLREPGLPWKTFQRSSLSLSHELGALSLSWSSWERMGADMPAGPGLGGFFLRLAFGAALFLR